MRNKEIVSLLFVWVILLPVSSGHRKRSPRATTIIEARRWPPAFYEEYEVRPRNQTGFFQAGERQGIGLSRVEEQETPCLEPHVL
jgi:hypothetical protein